MKKIYYDKITLGSGMSLMIGNKPDELSLDVFGIPKNKLDVSKFGLFESSTPNFHTYYPEIKNASDIKPKESDFINPVFRLLSEVIVRKTSNPVDFSMNNVLKNSMPKLLGQSVYANHDASIGNELGSVAEVSWQEAYITDSGIKVPAGINGKFKIDAKSHPNIARKILMEPPAIHSNSVTIEFGWEPSHTFSEPRDFFSKMGTYGSDGKLIRRIANEIRNYHETSLVSHGADPFAQLIDGSQITNPEYADSVYSLSAQGKEKPKIYFFSNREDIIELSSTPPNTNHIKPEEDMKQLIAALALFYKVPETEVNEAFITTKFSELTGNAEKLTKAEADLVTANTALATAKTELEAEKAKTPDATKLTAAETKVTELTAEVNKLKPEVEAVVIGLREEAKRVYGVLKGDKADAAKLAILEKSEAEALRVELKAMNEELEEKFPATCNDCKSHNITRNTAHIEDPNGNNGGAKLSSDQEVMDSIRSESKGRFLLDGNK